MPSKRSRKATTSVKAKRPAKKSKAKTAGRAQRPSRAVKRAVPPARRTPRPASGGHACPAQDPFGGPCQNIVQPGMRHCNVHSYLDRQ